LKQLIFIISFIFLSPWLKAQTETDSLMVSDTLATFVEDSIMASQPVILNQDSIKVNQAKRNISFFRDFISRHEYLPVTADAEVYPMIPAKKESDDVFFYVMIGLLVYFGTIRMAWPRYMENMAKVLRGSVRNQQLRDQMQQNSQPAMLLNILYVVNMSVFLAFVGRYFDMFAEEEFVEGVLYAFAVVSGLFLLQIIFLSFTGWLFNISSATNGYIFAVSLIRKLTGIILLPVLMILAFSGDVVTDIAVKVTGIIFCLLIFYRLLISYRIIRSQIKITWLHFFLYLCAFEVAPVLLVFKVLLNLMETN
jgi:hypothetical protein